MTAVAARRGRTLRSRRIWLAVGLLAPVVVWRLFTSIYPFIDTLRLSFTNNNLVHHTNSFTGLSNYRNLVSDADVRGSIGFTLGFTVVTGIIEIVLGLAVAELLHKKFRGRGFVRALNLLPWAAPAIVVGYAAQWAFDPNYGLVNDFIWRISGNRPLWLSSPELARVAVVLVDVWKNTSFLAVIFLAARQGISRELYEAARVDGATGWKAFRNVTLPLSMPIIVSMGLFTALWHLTSFDIVYALTRGGPGTSTSLLSYSIYVQGFGNLNFGYASALAMALFIIVAVVGVVGTLLLRHANAKF